MIPFCCAVRLCRHVRRSWIQRGRILAPGRSTLYHMHLLRKRWNDVRRQLSSVQPPVWRKRDRYVIVLTSTAGRQWCIAFGTVTLIRYVTLCLLISDLNKTAEVISVFCRVGWCAKMANAVPSAVSCRLFSRQFIVACVLCLLYSRIRMTAAVYVLKLKFNLVDELKFKQRKYLYCFLQASPLAAEVKINRKQIKQIGLLLNITFFKGQKCAW